MGAISQIIFAWDLDPLILVTLRLSWNLIWWINTRIHIAFIRITSFIPNISHPYSAPLKLTRSSQTSKRPKRGTPGPPLGKNQGRGFAAPSSPSVVPVVARNNRITTGDPEDQLLRSRGEIIIWSKSKDETFLCSLDGFPPSFSSFFAYARQRKRRFGWKILPTIWDSLRLSVVRAGQRVLSYHSETLPLQEQYIIVSTYKTSARSLHMSRSPWCV